MILIRITIVLHYEKIINIVLLSYGIYSCLYRDLVRYAERWIPAKRCSTRNCLKDNNINEIPEITNLINDNGQLGIGSADGVQLFTISRIDTNNSKMTQCVGHI